MPVPSFQYPSGEGWMLTTFHFDHALVRNTAAVFHMWRVDGSPPSPFDEFDWSQHGILKQMCRDIGVLCARGTTIGVNYFLQVDGKKYSNWLSNLDVVGIGVGDVIGQRSAACITKRGDGPNQRWLGRMHVPMIGEDSLADNAHFNVLFEAQFTAFTLTFGAGYTYGPMTFRPAVYSPTHDSFDFITDYRLIRFPRSLYRRRPRLWKVSHPALAPHQFGVAGHF